MTEYIQIKCLCGEKLTITLTEKPTVFTVHPCEKCCAGQNKLDKITEIIERVDHRASFGAVVTPTLQEMSQEEISEIYRLAAFPNKKKKGEAMNLSMNGKRIKAIYFSEMSEVTNDTSELFLEIDGHETWVVQIENGIEVARHNARHIETIVWAEVTHA